MDCATDSPRLTAKRGGAQFRAKARIGDRAGARRRLSVIVGTAVDVDGLAGDETAIVANQKHAGRGDLIDMPLAAQGDAGSTRHSALIPFRIVAPGIDAAGGDDVGA